MSFTQTYSQQVEKRFPDIPAGLDLVRFILWSPIKWLEKTQNVLIHCWHPVSGLRK